VSGETQEESVQICHLAVVGTVQFLAAVHGLKKDLESLSEDDILSMPLALPAPGSSSGFHPPSPPKKVRYRITIPQVKPLSPGEILGCTAPRLSTTEGIQGLLYIGDGRFHLESIMIANPWLEDRTYRYDPYEKKMTKEGYDHDAMRALRKESVQKAEKHIPRKMIQQEELSSEHSAETSNNWAVILGTLGRQGSLSVLSSITSHLPVLNTIPILLSELSPVKLSILQNVQVFVQTSCPRLSIDWGYAFTKPLLSPYEANVALGKAKADWMVSSSAPSQAAVAAGKEEDKKLKDMGEYPMDFYADESGGKWTPRFHVGVKERERKERMAARAKEREEKARLADLPPQAVQAVTASA